MPVIADDNERRKQQALRRLGTDEPRCAVCGEDDWRCLERHHLAGRAYGDDTVTLCRNCHRKQSDPADNSPTPKDPPLLERSGRFLLGLVALLLVLLTRLKQIGDELLAAAKHCPWPYGWVGAPPQGA